MENLHELANYFTKEPNTCWVLGLFRYAILYRKRNICRPNRTDLNFPKTTQPY